MPARLEDIFEGIAPPADRNPDKASYSVAPVAGYESYFVGKDQSGYACLLITTGHEQSRLASPIRLEKLDVQFDLRCHVTRPREPERADIFTVIRCRSLEAETIRYFLSVCDTIIGMIGDRPARREVSSAVHRLAAIFQKMEKPPARPLNGLFGELFVISRSSSPPRAMMAWRVDEMGRFDFADGNARMEVKATTGRARAHTFSYEQCTPPPGTDAIAASLFVERSAGGATLRALVVEIETNIAAYPDLVLKLHETIAGTLGDSLNEALAAGFDVRVSESSFRLYDLREVPAVRGALPPGVTDVHFQSDLSTLQPLSIQSLIERDAVFGHLLPRETRS
jgi:hypothetical protein